MKKRVARALKTAEFKQAQRENPANTPRGAKLREEARRLRKRLRRARTEVERKAAESKAQRAFRVHGEEARAAKNARLNAVPFWEAALALGARPWRPKSKGQA